MNVYNDPLVGRDERKKKPTVLSTAYSFKTSHPGGHYWDYYTSTLSLS